MLDLEETTTELRPLDVTCQPMGEDWLLIHRPVFDVVIQGEPFQTLQVIVHLKNHEYVVRLWGQTHQKGWVNSLEHLRGICEQSFKQSQVCLGLTAKLSSEVRCVTYPVKRFFSKQCLKISGKTTDAAAAAMCKACEEVLKKHSEPDEDDQEDGEEEDQEDQEVKQDDFEDEDGDDDDPMSKVPPEVKLETDEYDSDFDADEFGGDDDDDDEDDDDDDDDDWGTDEIKKEVAAAVAAAAAAEDDSKYEPETKYEPEEYLKEGVSCKICGKQFKHFGPLRNHERRVHSSRPKELSRPPHLLEAAVAIAAASASSRKKGGGGGRGKGGGVVKPPRIRPRHYVCEFCNKPFESRLLCLEHRTSHTGEKLFHCKECGKGFGFVSSYNYHVRMHLRKKGLVSDERQNPLYHYCEHCGKRFSDKNHMKMHIDVEHLNVDMSVSCDKCGETCSNRGRLLEHVNKHHRQDPRYQCVTCGKRFGAKHALDRHQLVHAEPLLECKFCGKKVKKRENLLNHERIHTGETPFRCTSCHLAFRSRPALSLHKRTHCKTETVAPPPPPPPSLPPPHTSPSPMLLSSSVKGDVA